MPKIENLVNFKDYGVFKTDTKLLSLSTSQSKELFRENDIRDNPVSLSAFIRANLQDIILDINRYRYDIE